MNFTFLFLNLANIHIFIPKCTKGGGWGPPVQEIFLKNDFFSASLSLFLFLFILRNEDRIGTIYIGQVPDHS